MFTAKILCHLVITRYHQVPKFLQCRTFSVSWWCVFTKVGWSHRHFVASGLVGKVDFTVRHLSSTVQTFPNSFSGFSSGLNCPVWLVIDGNMELPFSLLMTFSLFLLSVFTFHWTSTSLWLHLFFSVRLLPHRLTRKQLGQCVLPSLNMWLLLLQSLDLCFSRWV